MSVPVPVSVHVYVCACVCSLGMRVQLYLRIDRADLAQRELRAMKALDEDSTLSMLATAWVSLAMVSTELPEH
jgi:coatomer protein complex subunit epsilon